ncbi:MAG TPA: DUF1573 domain-containing protein [Moheibacter sp.]|nr:DUF1573 domain-containing protein [Moheibacter sp.]
MNKFLLVSAFLLSGWSLLSAQQITLSETTVDLGRIAFGNKAQTTIDIKNTGDKPLIINNVSSACDCVRPTWSKEAIAPGSTTKMTIEYTKSNIEGAFNQTVTISSNAISEGRKIFRIKGIIEK